MKTVAEIKEKEMPLFTIDNRLNKYEKVVLFPKLLAKASAMVKRLNLKSEDLDKFL